MRLSGAFGIVVLMAFLLAGSALYAATFYWIDENGTKHFTEFPDPERECYTMSGEKVVYEASETGSEWAEGLPSMPATNFNAPPGTLKDEPKPGCCMDICSNCLEGIFKDIRNCDIDALRAKLKQDRTLLDSETDPTGWTPLTMAVASGCKITTEYLIYMGADVNELHRSIGFSPLHLAVFMKREEMVDFLLEKGANINRVIKSKTLGAFWYARMGGTPLHTAISKSSYEMLEHLLKRGADYKVRNHEGRTAFEFACDWNHRADITAVYQRLGIPVPAAEVSVDELMSAISACGATSTAERGKRMANKFLSMSPGLAREKGRYGRTPLHMAAFYNLTELVKKLIELGADVNAKNDLGNTPLHSGSLGQETIRILLANGARVNEQNGEGKTLLHMAANSTDHDVEVAIVELLLASGASKSIRDMYDQTPYDIANSRARPPKRIVELLK